MSFLLRVPKWKIVSVVVPVTFIAVAIGFVYQVSLAERVWSSTHNDELALFISGGDALLKHEIASYYFNGGAYDLKKAEKYYQELYEVGIRDRLTLYQLGRIYFVNGRFLKAIKMLDLQLELFPDEKRAYYMRGLINIYTSNFEEAVRDFSIFVGWSPDEWPGYNDLAWAYFKRGIYKKTAEVAQNGLERFPRNMWLHNMAGVALWNLGDLEEAEEHLILAEELVTKMTIAEWGVAYPGNDPSTYSTALEAMRKSVSENLNAVKDEILEGSGN